MSLRPVAFAACLLLAGCGYHLAGQGRGVVPEDVHSVGLVAVGKAAQELLPAMRRQIQGRSGYYALAEPSEADAEFRLDGVTESYTPTAFDTSGVAVTYSLTLSGSLSLWQKGAKIWDSGTISASGDVYVLGDPASTEALRRRLKQDLQKQWVRDVFRALSSYF